MPGYVSNGISALNIRDATRPDKKNQNVFACVYAQEILPIYQEQYFLTFKNQTSSTWPPLKLSALS